MKQIGVAIRSRTVELVEVVSGKITCAVRAPIAGPKEAHLLEALLAALEQAKVRPRRASVSVPSQDVLLRFFSLPTLPKAEWENAIRFEARRHIPFRTEDLVWDSYVQEDRARKQLAAIFAGMKKDRFDEIRRCLQQVGITPSALEPQNVSLARVAAMGYPRSRQDFLGLVELTDEGDGAHLSIVRDGMPYLARDVNLLPRSESPVTPPAPEVAVPMTEPVRQQELDLRGDRLASELRLSLDFFTREYASAIIARIVIFGDPSLAGPWSERIAQQLHCQVELGALPVSSPGLSVSVIPAASSVGLALHDANRGSAKLDFLTRAGRRGAGLSRMRGRAEDQLEALSTHGAEFAQALAMSVAKWLAAGLVMLGLIAYFSHQQVTTAEADLAALRQQPSAARASFRQQDEAGLKALQEQVGKKESGLRRVFESRLSMTEKLDALAKQLPEGFWLEGLTYSNVLKAGLEPEASLQLRGACFLPLQAGHEFEAIGQFSDQMKQNERFFRGFASAQLGEIATANVPKASSTYRTFKFTCDSGGKL